MIDYTSIIGYALFAFSEIIPLLPIPANGILHSLSIGIKNSFTKQPVNTDIEMAHSLVETRPQLANVVSLLEGNFRLTDSVKLLNSKPQLIPLVEKIATDKNMQFINSLLASNPDIINHIKRMIISQLTNQEHNVQVVQNTQPLLNIPTSTVDIQDELTNI